MNGRPLPDKGFVNTYVFTMAGMAPDFPDKTPTLPPDFQQAANSAAAIIEPPKVMVSLQLDADLLAYLGSPDDLFKTAR